MRQPSRLIMAFATVALTGVATLLGAGSAWADPDETSSVSRSFTETDVSPSITAQAVAQQASVSSVTVPDQSVRRTDVNAFVFDSFDAEYELGRDDEGRSTLNTIETIVAVFPDYDQNRGFIRDIPREYNGYDTQIDVISVTDENGEPRPYTTENYGEYLSVTMAVPEGSFVHGEQTYVLEYTQRDVTQHFAAEDAGADSVDGDGIDEFYWDVNGTEWMQPFGRVSARLTLAKDLVDAFSGAATCYRGSYASTAQCELTTEGRTIIASEVGFAPYENLTLAAGFTPGTFTMPQPPFLVRVPILIYGGIASLLASLALTVFWSIRNRRGEKTGRAIIAQYEPPEKTTAALSAEMVGASKKAMTATLLDLAVRKNIRLLFDEPSDQYGAQALSETGLEPNEKRVYEKIFGTKKGAASAGDFTWFDKSSTRLGDAAKVLREDARASVVKHGLKRKPKKWPILVAPLLMILALGLPILHAVILADFLLMTILLAVGINVLVWVLIGVVVLLATGRPRTAEGALLHDHLMGLREYIRLAEADRIRMLQSASGAEVSDERIVQVYERLLPYAVIFGYEDEWQAELMKYYRESTPDWADGSGVSGIRIMPLTGLHTAIASSPITRPVSSSSGLGSSFSSSGGSFGGGFSGGGGGGGGGRGI